MKEISHEKFGTQDNGHILEFADRISASWQKTVESIFETRAWIIDARKTLSPIDYKKLTDHLDKKCGMSKPTITKLTKISENEILTAPANIPKLPPSYGTLYQLTRYEYSQLSDALETDQFTPSIQRKKVIELFEPEKTKPKTRHQKPLLKVSLTGTPTNIPEDELANLRAALNDLQTEIEVKLVGIKF